MANAVIIIVRDFLHTILSRGSDYYMKKIKKVGCMILVVVLMTVSISTTQVDASIASEAKNIEIGQKLTATFGNGETISYKFVLSKKSTITLSGYFKSNYDQNITLYKKNGYKIQASKTI